MKKATVGKQGKGSNKYRTVLQDKKLDLLSSLGVKFDTIASMGRVAEEDQAQVSHEEFISIHLNGIEYEKLRLVQEALDRLDAGEYGICQACEEPIAQKRLDAIPWALYCVRCQEKISAMDGPESESILRLADAVNSL